MEDKLYRNEYNRVIAGVASGLADHLQVDVILLRILFVLSTIFFAGIGLITYIVMWIILPSKNDWTVKFSKFKDYYKNNPCGFEMFNSSKMFDNQQNSDTEANRNTENAHLKRQPDFSRLNKVADKSKTIIGIFILSCGFYFFLLQMGWLPWSYFDLLYFIYKSWPVVIIATGLILIFKNKQKAKCKNLDDKDSSQSTEQNV